MKKQILCGLLIIVLVISSGCSKMPKTLKSSEDKEQVSYSANKADGFAYQKGEMSEVSKSTADATNSSSKNSGNKVQRKIIKNGYLNLEATDVEEAYTKILNYAIKNKGYEFKRGTSKNGKYSVITAQIKISPEGLDLLMNYAGDQAEVINSKVSSDDISANYYDSQTRLTTSKNSLVKYYEFLQQSKNIDETLRIQTEINRITMEIESLEGQIKMWDALISESTLDITINEKGDPLKIKQEIKWNALSFSHMGTLIKRGFVGTINILASILQWLAIILLTISPLLVIVVIVLIIKIRIKRAKKRIATNKKDE